MEEGDAMNDDGYEYKLADDNPRAVMVRLKYSGRGRYPAWGLYMLADSEEQAEHVLFLLQNPRVGTMEVRE
jgi:hypothetical protein